MKLGEKLPHEVIIFPKFHKNWAKIVDFFTLALRFQNCLSWKITTLTGLMLTSSSFLGTSAAWYSRLVALFAINTLHYSIHSMSSSRVISFANLFFGVDCVIIFAGFGLIVFLVAPPGLRALTCGLLNLSYTWWIKTWISVRAELTMTAVSS